jgi:hydrogenase maturation protease
MSDVAESGNSRPLPLIVGLGSPHGDDQAGWIVVDRVKAMGAGLNAMKVSSVAEILLLLEGQPHLIIVDAAAPANRPGRVQILQWPFDEINGASAWSSHGIELADTLQLAGVLGNLPQSVTIATVEALEVRPDGSVSKAVEHGIERLVDSILKSIMSSRERALKAS